MSACSWVLRCTSGLLLFGDQAQQELLPLPKRRGGSRLGRPPAKPPPRRQERVRRLPSPLFACTSPAVKPPRALCPPPYAGRRFTVRATPMQPLSAVVADVLSQLKLEGLAPEQCTLSLKGKKLDLATPVRFANVGREKLVLVTGGAGWAAGGRIRRACRPCLRTCWGRSLCPCLCFRSACKTLSLSTSVPPHECCCRPRARAGGAHRSGCRPACSPGRACHLCTPTGCSPAGSPAGCSSTAAACPGAGGAHSPRPKGAAGPATRACCCRSDGARSGGGAERHQLRRPRQQPSPRLSPLGVAVWPPRLRVHAPGGAAGGRGRQRWGRRRGRRLLRVWRGEAGYPVSEGPFLACVIEEGLAWRDLEGYGRHQPALHVPQPPDHEHVCPCRCCHRRRWTCGAPWPARLRYVPSRREGT